MTSKRPSRLEVSLADLWHALSRRTSSLSFGPYGSCNRAAELLLEELCATGLFTTSEGVTLVLRDCRLCGVDSAGEPPEAYSTASLPALAARIGSTASLTALDLSRNRLGDPGALAVAAAIEAHRSLRRLGLAANAIGCEGCRALAGALRRSGSLTAVNLLRNHWDEASAAALAAVPAERPGLRTLCGLALTEPAAALEHEGLEARDALLLAADCRAHGGLTALRLYDNRLGAAGACALAAAVSAGSTLAELDLSSNSVGGTDDPARLVFVPCADGAAALAAALRDGATLRSLLLYDNALGPRGGALLAKALRGNTSLTHLDLRLNQLCGVDSFGNGEPTLEAVRALAYALEANSTLRRLALEHNALPPHAAGWMREAARTRTSLRLSL